MGMILALARTSFPTFLCETFPQYKTSTGIYNMFYYFQLVELLSHRLKIQIKRGEI